MASSGSLRMLVTPHPEVPSRLTVVRHQLPQTPTYDSLDTATAQIIAATIVHIKSLTARGYRQFFKRNNITKLITSSISTLSFYCFVAFLTYHTKPVTLCTAYELGLSVSLVMILETYDTIHAMMMGLGSTMERIRTVDTHLLCATNSLGLLNFSFGTAPDSVLGKIYSPGLNPMPKGDNAATKAQHRKERSTSKTKERLHNDSSAENHCTPKADENTKSQQNNTIPYVLNLLPQHSSSKAQPPTYKTPYPNLNIRQKPTTQPASDSFPPQTPEVMQPNESPFQTTLRNSMHRSKRLRRTRSERSSEDSYLDEAFRIIVRSESESSAQNSIPSSPDSEASTSTTGSESEFQTDLRMSMLLGSSSLTRSRRARESRRSTPSLVETGSESLGIRESEFQMKFREAVWPGRRELGMGGRNTRRF